MDEVLRSVEGVEPARLALAGSSLGGFYATYLAHRLGCRAALLNPAVNPARDLRAPPGRNAAQAQKRAAGVSGGADAAAAGSESKALCVFESGAGVGHELLHGCFRLIASCHQRHLQDR